jgi:hypothetical protein
MTTKIDTKQQQIKKSGVAFPQDVKERWVHVTRRLQSVCRSGGLSLVSITVLVDENGLPIMWLEPDVRLIEPRKSAQDIIAMLAAKQGVRKFEKI